MKTKKELPVRVTEAKYTRRINLGNYEHEELSLTAIVEDGDTAVGVLAQLKADIVTASGGEAASGPLPPPPPEDAGPEAVETPEEKLPKKSSKKSKPVPTTIPTSKPAEEEVVDDEDEEAENEDGSGDDSTPDDEEEEQTIIEEDEDDVEEEPAPKKKSFKKKSQTYQRANETHKDIFSGVMTAVAPAWKKTFESKALAKKVSQKMEGVDFLDEDGGVFASFKEQVRSAMNGKKK